MKKHKLWRAMTVIAVGFLATAAGGCRAHPGSLLGMLAGDAINDLDVKSRRDKLMGRPEAASDEMFETRLETLDDVEWPDVRIIMYPNKIDLLKATRYVVELEKGKIVAFTKIKRNIDGIEDLIHDANLEKKVLGKTPSECSKVDDLGKPLRTLRNREKNQTVRFYDIRHWTDIAGARYCVLTFNDDERCLDVTLFGVTATTKKDPVRRSGNPGRQQPIE
jgi:hypothetical protein